MLKISEIFRSIQGESTYQGQPCTFVRLAGCNLDCIYCDTGYANKGSANLSIEQIINKTREFSDVGLVEITGGEPLLQNNVHQLAEHLLEREYTVLLETNGSIDTVDVDERIIKVIDVKCPSSGQSSKVCWQNLKQLKQADQVKFVLADEADYKWAKKVITDHSLESRCQILLSTVWEKLSLATVADWMLKDNLQAILQPQLHKVIWGPSTKK